MLFPLLVLVLAIGTGYWSLKEPGLASWTFIGTAGGFGLLLLAQNRFARAAVPGPGTPPLSLSPIEYEVVWSHPLFFQAPLTCRQYSSAASAVQIACIAWTVWLLYSGVWIQSLAMIVVFLIAGNAARTLNPQHFYSYASRKGEAAAIGASARAVAVQRVLDRLYADKDD